MWTVNDELNYILITQENYPLLPHLAKVVSNQYEPYDIFVQVGQYDVEVGTAFGGQAHFKTF